MTSKVRKIGNSAGIILPKPVLAALGVSEGAAVEFVFEALAKEGLTEEDREWLGADLTSETDDEWDASSEEDMARIEAQLRADGVVKP
jgi:antitoxin MazE